MGTVESQVATQVTDGFHLVIDALKLNGIDTIFGLPGIPITDFTRYPPPGSSTASPHWPTPPPIASR